MCVCVHVLYDICTKKNRKNNKKFNGRLKKFDKMRLLNVYIKVFRPISYNIIGAKPLSTQSTNNSR